MKRSIILWYSLFMFFASIAMNNKEGNKSEQSNIFMTLLQCRFEMTQKEKENMDTFYASREKEFLERKKQKKEKSQKTDQSYQKMKAF